MGRIFGGVDINNKFLATGQGSYITIHPSMAELKNTLLAQTVLKPRQGSPPSRTSSKRGAFFKGATSLVSS